MRKLLKKLADWWEGEYTPPDVKYGPDTTFFIPGGYDRPWLRRIFDASVAWTRRHADQLIIWTIGSVLGGIALTLALKWSGLGTQP